MISFAQFPSRKTHELDVHHPVANASSEISDSLALNMVPNIDIWGINLYR